ncbi:TonB-dependent receptor [uncultured Erythrobacter sp.]|uniref:TonB-dependent receptor plug domain-containing protein n=1 Tax=uncultured Erythrobacter sp. TaxID=263913 RepID=UPI00261DA787|nr:TonB-dependent receptor [uncultured Erythrobacter sp.]
MMRSFTSLRALALLGAGMILAPQAASAQDNEADTSASEGEGNAILVTGSRIRRQSQADLASPLATLGSENISDIGAQNIGEITQTLTINSGAQNNPDAFTQGGTTGTSNINLRGLGVASTLILLNGKRQTLSAAPTNDGINFVDTSSLIPLIAVDRVEILKDGASSLYGSDAVAGVVNFITRENYEGFTVSGEYTTHTSEGDYSEYNLQALGGINIGDLNLLAAVSYVDRTALTTAERRLSEPADDTSSLGNPGSFFGVPGFPAGAPVIDPGCADAGGFPNVLSATPAGVPDVGFCGFDFGEFFNLVPDEERLTIFVSADLDISDSVRWSAEVGYADNEATRGNSPTFPFLQLGQAVVPDFNPNNPFGANVVFFGRAIGNGGDVSPATFESETFRVSSTLEGDFDGLLQNGLWNISATYAENNFDSATEDTVTDRFACALRGFNASPAFNAATGLDCTAANPFLTANGASIPTDGTFFNPFSSALLGGAANSAALLDYITEFAVSDRGAELFVVEGFVSGELFELPSGPVGIAVGAQYREQQISADFDSISVGDGFAFLIGEQPFAGTQDVYAIFGEANVPLAEWADLQLALRFEDYGADGGDTLDPKFALLVRPTDTLSLRGSFSTSFRAPSTFQLQGQSTTLQQVSDPLNGGANAFVAVRAVGNAALTPETSDAFNFGFTYEPIFGLEISADYYNFEFDDAIVQTAPQSIVDADPDGPNVIRSPAGTIIQVNNSYVNAASVETSGIDFSIRYRIEADFGTITPSFEGNYVFDYDLQTAIDGPVINGAGNRNFTNFGSPTPELRFNAGLQFETGAHAFNIFGRFIDSYDDDQNGGANIESDFRVDAQYSIDVADFLELDNQVQLTAGVRNLFGVTAPSVATNGGFDSRVHDPRGTLVTVGLVAGF